MKLMTRGQVKFAAALLGTTGLSGVAAPIAQAQEAGQQVRDFDVPAQTLSAAAVRFSEQAGVQLVIDSNVGGSVQSKPVRGRMTAENALQRMLAGTGLTWRVFANGTITIVSNTSGGDVAAAEGERVLGPVRVEGSQGAGSYERPERGDTIAQLGGERGRQADEAQGFRANVVSVSTGAPVPIEDVPRSITVQTQEQIEKQDISNIGEALRRLPGVTLIDFDAGGDSSIIVRGQELTKFTVDGGAVRPLELVGNGNLNLDAYERVELVRGPNSQFSGAQSLGGSLNLVRKRPGDEPTHSVQIEAGNYSRVGMVADVSTPHFLGSNLAFRSVVSVRREGSFVDGYDSTNLNLYGIFDAPLGDAARIELGFEKSNLDSTGQIGGPIRDVAGTLIELPRSYYPQVPGAYFDSRRTEFFTNLYVDVADDVDLQLNAFYNHNKTDLLQGFKSLAINPDGTFAYGSIEALRREFSTQNIGISAKTTARFETLGLQHNAYASFDFSTSDTPESGGGNQTLVAFANLANLDDYLNPVYLPRNQTRRNLAYAGQRSSSLGFVIGDSISWRDLVTANVSVRYDKFNLSSIGVNRTPTAVSSFILRNEISYKGSWRPNYSLVIHPIKNVSLFGSYSDGFLRSELYGRRGSAPDYTFFLLPPTPTKTYELGAKYARQGLLASATYYNSSSASYQQDGTLSVCPPSLGANGYISPCYTDGLNALETKGVDVEVQGMILPGLQVVGNYNYNKAIVPETGSFAQTVAPQSSASLFLDWAVPFASGLSLQGGVSYKSRYFSEGTQDVYDDEGNYLETVDFEVAQKPYTVFDLGFEYRIDDSLTFKVLVENILDKKYLSNVSVFAEAGNFWGKPRTAVASIKYKGFGKRRSGFAPLAPFGAPEDWYAGMQAGYSMPQTISATAAGRAQDGISPVNWDFNLDNGVAYFGKVGKYVTGGLRFELEGSYNSSKIGTIGGSPVAPFGVCDASGATNGEPFDCSKVPGRFDTWTLFGNVLLDFRSRDKQIRPYVGGGLGVARTSISFSGKLDGIGPNTPWITDFGDFILPNATREVRESITSIETSTSLVVQAIAGVDIALTDRLSLDGSWRYIHMPKLRFDSYNLDTRVSGQAALTPRLGEFSASSSAHIVSLGLRWTFGTRTK